MAAQYFTVEYKVDGVDQVATICKQLPEKFAKKPLQKAFRTASKPFIKQIGTELPTSLKTLKKAIKTKNMKGAAIKVGAYTKNVYMKLKNGQYYDAYYPLYWHNYGTNERRDPSHRFTRSRKAKTAHWRGGITPGRFMEMAWEKSHAEVQRILESDLKKQMDGFLEKSKVA